MSLTGLRYACAFGVSGFIVATLMFLTSVWTFLDNTFSWQDESLNGSLGLPGIHWLILLWVSGAALIGLIGMYAIEGGDSHG